MNEAIKLKTVVLTDAQEVEHLNFLVEHAPNVHFSIGAYTEVGPLLKELDSYQNVTIFETISESKVDELMSDMDCYLDINHYGEVHSNPVERTKQLNKPILAFDNTQHGEKGQEVFSSTSPEKMLERLEQLLYNKQHLISIIVPVYNVENYVELCLTSILSQTYTNFEVIIVNDGSTDKSGKICDNFASQDDRIRVIHQKNKGLSAARNKGLENSLGEYITFIDSDDWIKENYLEELVKLAMKNDADIVIGKYQIYNDDLGVFEFFDFNSDIANTREITVKELLESILHSKYYLLPNTSWGKIYRKNLFNNLRFPEGRLYEDVVLNFMLYKLANKIIIAEEFYYWYRNRSTSISLSKFTVRDAESFMVNMNELFMLGLLYTEQGSLFLREWYQWYIAELTGLKTKIEHFCEDYRELPVYKEVIKWLYLVENTENIN